MDINPPPLLYDAFMWPMEALGLDRIRGELAKNLNGRILEIGAGTGRNFRHIPENVETYSLEPDAEHMKMARKRLLKEARLKAHLILGTAEDLGRFEDNYFDGGLATLVFCTIPDVSKALGELRRVLKPGARIYLLEHVASRKDWIQRGFEWARPGWEKIAGGCRLGQDTPKIFREHGFEVSREHYYNSFLLRFEAVNPA